MHERQHRTEESSFLNFDPITILLDVARRWYLIVAAALLVSMATYIVSDMAYSPTYTTTTTFVATARGSSTTVYQNLSATTNLASVFSEVLNSSILRAAILEELGLDSFNGTISAAAIPETNLLTLRVSASDPRTAFLVTRSVIENHHIVSYQVLGDTVLEVLQSPVVPAAPSNANSAPHTAKRAAQLTALAVCALLAVLSYLRDAVRSRREAEEKLDCRCLGEILHEKKYKTLKAFLRHNKTSILISKPDTSFHFVEAIRKLRRKVEQRLDGKNKVLLVTSVLENEGKSTIAVNLALSLAQKHERVLLIDCDIRKPACYKLLDRQHTGPGTIAVITGEATVEDAVVQDKATGLHLLLESTALQSSTHLSDSEGMEQMLSHCRELYDYVILDLPPMSASPDVECVMEFADRSLLVVRQNAAAADRLNSAAAVLQGSGAKLLGCVINNVCTSPLADRGNYGYGYGYYGKYGKYGKYSGYGYNTSGKIEQ